MKSLEGVMTSREGSMTSRERASRLAGGTGEACGGVALARFEELGRESRDSGDRGMLQGNL